MATITQKISDLPDVAGRFDNDFITTADKFLNVLPKFSDELNHYASQANDVRKDVNDLRDDTKDLKDDTTKIKDQAVDALKAYANFDGEWDSDKDYNHPISVMYKNTIYMSKQDSKDKNPETEVDYWQPVTLNREASYAMTETQFKAVQERRKQEFAGSGFVDFKIPLNFSSVTNLEDLISGKLNVNGYLLNTKTLTDLKLPNPATSLFIITNSSDLNDDMKQGDFAILKDTDRELVTNGTFDNDINGWDNGDDDRGSIRWDDDNARLQVTNDGDEDYPYAIQTLQTIKNVKYKVKVSVTINDADKVRVYLGGNLLLECSDDIDYEGEWVSTKNGDTDITLFVYETGNTGHISYFDNVSIKQIEQQPLVSLQNADKGIDIYDSDNADKFEARDSITRSDLVFLEVWEEDIDDKDFVYPYGNIQYRGSSVEDIDSDNLVDGSFTGYDTYSLFGNWQSAGDLVGKGYKWSDLGILDRIKILSNPEHNIYTNREGKYIQVRYRIRVVKGLGNEWVTIQGFEESTDLSYIHYYYPVTAKGNLTDIDDIIYKTDRTLKHSNNAIFNYNDEVYALPIALIQRPNDGIYHSIYNPFGCAFHINDDNDDKLPLEEFAFDNSKISSLEGCFNHDKITAVKYDSDNNPTYKKLSDVEDDSDYVRTGLIESKVTANPYNRYCDEINEADVEDLRMSAKNKVLKEIHNTERMIDINGERRGKENLLLQGKKFEFNLTIDTNTTIESTLSFYRHTEENTNIDVNGCIIIQDEKNNILHSFYGFVTRTAFGVRKKYLTSNRLEFVKKLEDGDKIKLTIFGKDNLGTTYNSSYQFNNHLLQTDIIGDPRKIEDRIEYTTGADEQIDIHKNMYIKKGEDDGNNGGTKDHLYRYLGDNISNVHTNSTDGDANADDGHIDFSDDTLWLDLGDDLTIGAYKDEWLSDGFAGTPLIVGEEGENINPINDLVEDSDGNYIKVKLSRKYISEFRVYVQDKDGKFVEYSKGDENNEKEYSVDTTLNEIKLNIEDSYSGLNYGSEQEMLDLMKVIVIYQTQTNTTELANNSEVLDVYPMTEKGYSSDLNEGVFVTSNLINKIPTDGNYTYQNNCKVIDYMLQPFHNNILNPNNKSNSMPNHSSFDFSESSDIPQIKQFTYLTQENNRLYLQYVFKELKYDSDEDDWGDDNKFQITDKVSTTDDDNDNTVLIGQKRVPLPYFYKGDE